MTTTTRNNSRSRSSYYTVEDDSSPALIGTREATVPQKPTCYSLRELPRREPTVATGRGIRWIYSDTVAELVEQLASSGRKREAAAVRRVLGYEDDEEAMRAYVSRLWADDWDSDEDSVYDE